MSVGSGRSGPALMQLVTRFPFWYEGTWSAVTPCINAIAIQWCTSPPGICTGAWCSLAVIGWVMTSPFRNLENISVFSESGSPSKCRK